MDKIILGLLMLERLTVYEIRAAISKNFKSICSDSMGSIQAAIKKLLEAQLVTYSEYVEKSVNKKRYSITDKGRETLTEWLKHPANLSNAKSMELGKLLFMGLVPADRRLALVDEMIIRLENELASLLGLQASVGHGGIDEALAYWRDDPFYYEGIRRAVESQDMTGNAEGIVFFQTATLQYGIDFMKFTIEWLTLLKTKMGEGFTE